METVIKTVKITDMALQHLVDTGMLVYNAMNETYSLSASSVRIRTTNDYDDMYSAYDADEIEKMHKLIVGMLDAGMPLDVLFERIMGL